MKMILFILGTVFLCTSANLFAQSTETACPATSGAYYRIAGVWQPMDPVRSIGFKSTGVAKAAFSYGAAKMKLKAQFREPRSPYQLKDESLSICLVGLTDNGRDITVAKLQKEKDRRELQMASIGTWSGLNAQIDPKLVLQITVSKLTEKTFLISSAQPMVDGEFILFTIVPDVASMVRANTPQSLTGYDFGSHKN